MVMGFDKFREHFRGFDESYIIIGGSACDWLMDHIQEIPFRATHDIDLVLCAEAMTPEFGLAMWKFIRDGGYSVYEKKDGMKQFFRFMNPSTLGYPSQLEFFAREPIDFKPADGSTFTPIPLGEDISSLSGILLDRHYYEFIKSFKRTIDGVCVLSEEALLILKARAWKDFTDRKARGEFVKDKDLRKHRLDIVRLQALIPPSNRVQLSPPLLADFQDFLAAYSLTPTDPAAIGVEGITFDAMIEKLRAIYTA